MRDLIIGCISSRPHLGFTTIGDSRPGVQKVTLIPCSERMREWLGMHVKEMGANPYDVQDGLRNNFSSVTSLLLMLT